VIDVIVQRENPLPYRGPDIVEPLLGSEESAVTRGKQYLSEEGAGVQPIQYVMPFRPGVRLGQMVQVIDSILGLDVRGKITRIEHKISRSGGKGSAVSVLTTLTIKVPTDFQVLSNNS
jgi:hypothetical protein